ncbi:hypothetical protein XENORESO_000756 [Xenotaenia resolanae]|uniref:Uncharacterized protein n=1 Tax=Xenotaenia resolanae TaxID=208358 RepID=A0ABV0WJA8_9TELE
MCNFIFCRWYYIAVVPEILVSLKGWGNPEDIDIYEILEAGTDSTVQMESQDLRQLFIAAKIDVLPKLFILGDNKKYNGYYNRPLPILQQLRCFVLADLKDQESLGLACSRRPFRNKKSLAHSVTPDRSEFHQQHRSLMDKAFSSPTRLAEAIASRNAVFRESHLRPIPPRGQMAGDRRAASTNCLEIWPATLSFIRSQMTIILTQLGTGGQQRNQRPYPWDNKGDSAALFGRPERCIPGLKRSRAEELPRNHRKSPQSSPTWLSQRPCVNWSSGTDSIEDDRSSIRQESLNASSGRTVREGMIASSPAPLKELHLLERHWSSNQRPRSSTQEGPHEIPEAATKIVLSSQIPVIRDSADYFDRTNWEIFEDLDLEVLTDSALGSIEAYIDIVIVEKYIRVYPSKKP